MPIPLLVLAVLVLGTLLPRPASAQRAIVADLDSPPDLHDQAAAVSLLTRSMLSASRRPLVPRHELGIGLKAVDKENAKRHALTVEPAVSEQLLYELKADRLFLGALARDGKRLVVNGTIFGPKGSRIVDVNASAPPGELTQLARLVAQRVAPRIDAAFIETANVPLGALRPYIAASSAMLRSDAAGAARVLELANPAVASKVPATREIAESVWHNTSLPVEDRIRAAMAAGDPKSAVQLADEALKEDPRNITARAGKVRALTALNDTEGAEKELGELKSARNNPTVAIARAELALRLGTSADDRDAALQPLLAKSNPSMMRAALAFVASTPPKSFGDKVETASVQAAEKVAAQEPGLASAVAARAVAGGVEVPRALKLVQSSDLGMDELAVIQARLDAGVAAGDPSALKLEGEISARKEAAREVRLSQTRPGSGARLGVADELGPLLGELERLKRRGFARVLLVPLTGSGQPIYSPFAVRPTRLRDGLVDALTAVPFNLATADAKPGLEIDETTANEESLTGLAAETNADVVIGYRVRATGLGLDAQVHLMLFDVNDMKAYVVDGSVGGTDLLRLNPFPIAGALVTVVGLVLFIVLGVLRGGLTVHIKRDPASKEEMFSILVTRSAKAPAMISSAEDYIERTRKQGPTHKRNLATMVGTETKFRNLGPGVWYVHLYGTYTKGGENRILADGLMQEVEVKSRQSAWASFNLEPSSADIQVSVHDGDAPVGGALVWLDDARGKAIPTKGDGLCVISAPKGNHRVSVDVKGLVVERPISVTKSTAQELKVNLAWERRVDDVSRALEGAPDDGAIEALERRRRAGDPTAQRKKPKPTAPGVADTMAAGRAADSNDGIYLGDVGSALAAANLTAAAIAGAPAASSSLHGLRRYKRLNELGRGAMGVVFRAQDLVLEREVALKIMADEIRTNKAVAEMFFQEAKSLASLNHPNVVTVFDQGQDGTEMYMVMEFVEGRTLADIIAVNGKLSLSMALDLADQLCAGMGYAHSKRIIHRDIKPANVFVTHQGNVKIGDFGLARAVRELKITKTEIRGTPLYMSPEQILGKDIDFRADLYSIGCTLYELVTGKPPFTEGEVLYHHLHTPPEPPSTLVPGIPAALDGLILACLAKDKAARIASAEEIRSALKPIRSRFG